MEEIIFDNVEEVEQPEFNDSFTLNELVNNEKENQLEVPYIIVDISKHSTDNEVLVRLLESIGRYSDSTINVYAQKNDKRKLASKIDKSVTNIANIMAYFKPIEINNGNGTKRCDDILGVMEGWT